MTKQDRTTYDMTMHDLATQCVQALADAHATLATAESITGGGVAHAITSVPGASAVFTGGVVAYDPTVKATVLGVDPDLLARKGAVDPQVADELAQGVRRLLGTTYALSTTGSAGPDPAPGGTSAPPVRPGTVYIALAGPRGTSVRALSLPGDRDDVRSASVTEALLLLASSL